MQQPHPLLHIGNTLACIISRRQFRICLTIKEILPPLDPRHTPKQVRFGNGPRPQFRLGSCVGPSRMATKGRSGMPPCRQELQRPVRCPFSKGCATFTETGPVRALETGARACRGRPSRAAPFLSLPRQRRARCGGAPMETGNRFSRCLLDQKDEEARRARRLRRRTLLLAILIQAILLTLLCLRPLFGAQELRLMARLVPLAPWKGQPGAHHPAPAPHPAAPHHLLYPNLLPPDFVFPRAHPAEQLQTDDAPDVGPISDLPSGGGFGDPNGLVPIPGLPGPIPPAPPAQRHEVEALPRGPRLVPSVIQQALLLVRVEPQYPALARQLRLEGTVQIRAVIATDGSVQSVEVLSGHPLLAQAARDAILRWRYRPTTLGGHAVEVETLITVIFKMH